MEGLLTSIKNNEFPMKVESGTRLVDKNKTMDNMSHAIALRGVVERQVGSALTLPKKRSSFSRGILQNRPVSFLRAPRVLQCWRKLSSTEKELSHETKQHELKQSGTIPPICGNIIKFFSGSAIETGDVDSNCRYVVVQLPHDEEKDKGYLLESTDVPGYHIQMYRR